MLARYSQKQGSISSTFWLSYSAVQRCTSLPSVRVSLSFWQCLLRQSTQSWKSSSVSQRCLVGLSLRVSMNMESATSMKASRCGGFLSSLLFQGITQPKLNGRLEQLMQLPFMNKLALLLSIKDCQKNFPPNSSFLSGSIRLASTAILYTLYPSVWLQDSMSLVGSTFLPLLLLQKQSLCLFFICRQSAGQLRYCFEQKHSYLGKSLLNLDCDRLRFSLFSCSWPDGSPRYINQLYTSLQSSDHRPLDISISYGRQRREKCSPRRYFLFVIIQISMDSKGKKGALMFIIFAVVWEVAVGIIYGLFFSYNESAFSSMESITTAYTYASTSGTSTSFKANTTQFPFPQAVVAIAIVLLIVGLSMVAGYIQRSTVTGMAFTLLIFALTVQNFFIFRNFWNRIGVNDSSAATNFSSTAYPYINSINFGNDLQVNYKLPSASFLDAVGAALAMYAGYTGVIGRIGMGEVFFLTWIGTFIYEVNSQILWRLYIPDNGYPSRAFAYGGMLGLVSSFILGKRELTKNNLNFKSSYKIMALAFLGIIFVWCSYPILVLSNVYTSASGKLVAMMGQVNIWLALATSVLGCYTASTLSYRKFCVHDMVFASITGAIAYSSSTDINYNPGAATAIGFSIGFLASLSQTRFKRMLNQAGVVDSNSVLFNFLLPSLFAAVFSAILEGVGESASSINYNTFVTSGSNTTFSNSTVTTGDFVGSGRTTTVQGGFQMAGWGISIGCGLVAGIIIGFVYRLLNDSFEEQIHFFNDTLHYDFPKVEAKKSQGDAAANAADPSAAAVVAEPPIPIESANNL